MTQWSRGRRRCVRDDCGAADALGMVIMAPAMIGLALVILLLSRDVDTRATAQSAAEAAAQAAAQERSAGAAAAAAQRVGDAMLIDVQTCSAPSVTLEPGPFQPGATVAVTVRCTTSTDGLDAINPPSRSARAYTAYAVIDPFRGVEG